MGFIGLEYDTNIGGAQMPLHVAFLARVPLAAANIGLCGSHITNTNSAIRLFNQFPNLQNKESLLIDMAIGKSHGSICLAERHSNSSITDIR